MSQVMCESFEVSLLLSPHSSHQLIGEIQPWTVRITVIKIHFLNSSPLGLLTSQPSEQPTLDVSTSLPVLTFAFDAGVLAFKI